MEIEKLIVECKRGLGMSTDPTPEIDDSIKQKILTVQAFLKGAGVSDERMTSDLATGVIVMGVTDLWNIKAGEIKFSPILYTLVTQLAAG